jgi:hypothetical protein
MEIFNRPSHFKWHADWVGPLKFAEANIIPGADQDLGTLQWPLKQSESLKRLQVKSIWFFNHSFLKLTPSQKSRLIGMAILVVPN